MFPLFTAPVCPHKSLAARARCSTNRHARRRLPHGARPNVVTRRWTICDCDHLTHLQIDGLGPRRPRATQPTLRGRGAWRRLSMVILVLARDVSSHREVEAAGSACLHPIYVRPPARGGHNDPA